MSTWQKQRAVRCKDNQNKRDGGMIHGLVVTYCKHMPNDGLPNMKSAVAPQRVSHLTVAKVACK